MRSSTIGLLVLCTFGLFALPLVATAQPSRTVPRLGMLLVISAAEPHPGLEAFRQGLRELGWVEGQNIALEYRYAEWRYERLPDLAAELVHLPVDVISPPVRQAPRRPSRLPPPSPSSSRPWPIRWRSGSSEGLARPGGNLTGVSGFAPELSGKCLELLKEVVPGLTRVAILLNPANPNAPSIAQETERAARAVGVQLQRVEVREPAALEGALATVLSAHADGLMVVTDPVLQSQRGRIVGVRHPAPVAGGGREEGVCGAGRPHDLWRQSPGPVAACGLLRGSHPKGPQARRPARRAAQGV